MQVILRCLALIVGVALILTATAGCNTARAGTSEAAVAPLPAAQPAAQPASSPEAVAETEAPPPAAGPAEAALEQAARDDKHLIVLVYGAPDDLTTKVRAVLAEARKTLAEQAVFHELKVDDEREAAFVERYRLADAPLPLTLVIAPNGAVVNAFVREAMKVDELREAFASRKYAEVLKLLQDRKLVLLCVQGTHTKHNDASLAAAKAVVDDEKAGGSIKWVQVAPEDESSRDLLTQLEVDPKASVAMIHILVPPATVAGKVEGATTKDKLWQAIASGVSSCGAGGCGPGGCG